MSFQKYIRGFLPIAGLACGTLICSSAIAGAVDLEVVLYSDLSNSPPGFPGLYWNLGSGSFSNPVIDESGKIAVQGTLFGDGITPANNRCIWYGDADGWTLVARNGEAAPGLAGLTFGNLTNNYPSLSPNGKMTLSSTLAGGGVTTANDTAFWYGAAGAHDLIAREGTTVAPGGAVLTKAFGGLTNGNDYRANSAGQVLFNSNLSGGDVVGTTNNFGVYIASASGITEVTRKGNPIPGAPALPDPSGPFMTPDAFGLFLNGAGEVLSAGTLVAGTAGGVTANDDKVVYTTVGGPLRLVARENDPVPGLTLVKYKPAAFFNLPTMGITNAGKVVYNATFDNIAPGTDVTAANDNGWLVDDHGTVSMVVREGDAIDGETFSGAASMFLTNNNIVVISGIVTGGGAASRLWTGPLGGPYTTVVKQGVTSVPGDPNTLLDFSTGSANPAVNASGQIVFISNLTGPDVIPFVNDTAMFGWDPTNGLVMIAREAVTIIPELLEVAQIAPIGGTGFSGDNGSLVLTDNGWLTFRLQDVKGFQAVIRARPFDGEVCAADVNGDEIVNVIDLLAVINAWGATGANPADVTGDRIVNVADMLLVVNGWGMCN